MIQLEIYNKLWFRTLVKNERENERMKGNIFEDHRSQGVQVEKKSNWSKLSSEMIDVKFEDQ